MSGKRIEIENQQSLVHLGSLDSFDITEGGKQCAKHILDYLKRGSVKHLDKAVEIYEILIPNENFGGEYTALEWLCKYWKAPKEAQEDMLKKTEFKGFLDELSANNYDNLKTYLTYKYHFKEYKNKEGNEEITARMRYLEDFILFNNPDRERWEKTRENLEKAGVKEGMKVADVGSGPGYYTFKFSKIVGDTGRVYASETNPRHLDYLRRYVRDNNVSNVEVVESSFNGIGLPKDIRVDIVYMCSLYHNIYAAFTDAERDEFIQSIRTALGENGHKLVIVDNDLVQNGDLPYHGPYINKYLIAAQLHYYGFELEDTFQFTPQRYVLVFNMTDIPKPESVHEESGENEIIIDSPVSVVRYRIIGTSTSGYTKRGKAAGRPMYEGINEGNTDKLKKAHDAFMELWPKERVGDDYTAFMWLIDYILADEKKKADMVDDKFTQEWVDFWCNNNCENLKTYLYYKFDLKKPDDPDASESENFEYGGGEFSIGKLNKWNEYMIFNNPNRVTWEHTMSMIDFLKIKEGERIADIGCGGGYFTWQFAKRVGDTGKVYATEINEGALSWLKDFTSKHGVTNIEPIITKMNDTGLPENSVDTIYMCSAYHAVYITNIEFVKDMFIASVHKALKKGGRFIVVDNAVTDNGVTPYYGPGIRPELIIAQLTHYGFHLVDKWFEIPQRFALIFEEDEDYVQPEIKNNVDSHMVDRGGKKLRGKKDKKNEENQLLQVLRPRRAKGFSLRRDRQPEGPGDDPRNDY